MENFVLQMPVPYYFGRGQIVQLDPVLSSYQRVLLVYGGGSIRRNGIYDDVLRHCHGVLTEFSGIESNPSIETVARGVEAARSSESDVIVAVGAGSVIDCAKAIAAGVYWEGDLWEMVTHAGEIQRALPLIAIPTAAATGSEFNSTSVISNAKLILKKGFSHPLLYPIACIADPSYTFSVPARQTRAGAADTMSHILEDYFKPGFDAPIADGIAEVLLRTVMASLEKVLARPDDYDARADLLYASDIGIKSLTAYGKKGTWSCHSISHALTAHYGVNHGESLAVITPFWMEQVLNDATVRRFDQFARNVFALSDPDPMTNARAGIDALRSFWKKAGLPVSLHELGIVNQEGLSNIAMELHETRDYSSAFMDLSLSDLETILRRAW